MDEEDTALPSLSLSLLERPRPQSAGTIKSQRRVRTRKAPPQKNMASDREITCVLVRNFYIFEEDFFHPRRSFVPEEHCWGGHHIYTGKNMGSQFAAWGRNLK